MIFLYICMYVHMADVQILYKYLNVLLYNILYVFNLKLNKFRTTIFFRYPEARAMSRKVVFHAGPTNSGKTYHALEKYLSSKSGVYCGPLKLLATEIYHKSNKKVSITTALFH